MSKRGKHERFLRKQGKRDLAAEELLGSYYRIDAALRGDRVSEERDMPADPADIYNEEATHDN